MRLTRCLEGLALLGFLGVQYFLAIRLARWWPAGGRRWRGWLDRIGARWLADFARRRGALLIKIGQFIATRPDIFPLTYVDSCSELRDQAPARPWSQVVGVLEHAYEGRISDHFTTIEQIPIAAASFGQVHRATLVDGSDVAVKVQHADLGPLVAADLWLARLALRLFGLALPGWPMAMIGDEIARTAREEQDYLQEAANADRLRTAMTTVKLHVPQIFWPHTREKVLVMAFAPGVTLARLDTTSLSMVERRRIADILIDGFLAQLLEVGFFHADPHAGNIIYDVQPEGPARIWLIDFGMTAQISARETGLYRRFLGHLRNNDTDGMVDCLIEIGFVLPTADRAKLKAIARDVYDQLAHMDPRSFKGSRRQTELAGRINEFLRRIDGLVFPQHTLLLSRATGLVEGLCNELVPGQGFLDLVKPRLSAVSWKTRIKTGLAEVRETWNRFRKIPDRLDELIAQRQTPTTSTNQTAVVAALLLIAALLLEPGEMRTIAASAAAVAVLFTLGRRS